MYKYFYKLTYIGYLSHTELFRTGIICLLGLVVFIGIIQIFLCDEGLLSIYIYFIIQWMIEETKPINTYR